jgi:hypothetical protein
MRLGEREVVNIWKKREAGRMLKMREEMKRRRGEADDCGNNQDDGIRTR